MASPIEFEISPNPRTREENQERAFIAASRRKDRSLDARLESANRASQLHKQRTGKALLITREIVEKEAMYEEVDDRYKEKLQRMLEAQNLQINTQFQQNLLATLAMRPGLQHRRASMMAQRGPIDGVRKMSLDLSSIRSSFSEGMRGSPITSPMAMTGNQSYVMSPSYDGNSHSPSSFHPNMMPASSGPMPSYVGHQSTPTWPAHIGPQHVRSPWAGFNPDMNMPVRHFRDRLGSAPVIPVHAIPSSAAYRPTPTPQHNRNRSEPGQTPAQRMPSHTPSIENTPRVEPRIDGLPSETLPTTFPTPDLCPTPAHLTRPPPPRNTPFLDQDFVDFQGLSFSLGSHPTIPSFDNTLHHPETEWKPDEVVQMDDWLVGA
ncbi:hypothetical protein AARAC_007169 [Aspergillus arachidicola]|uniref:Uncharacterized protein n=1 Tax=Aspergillus arachidicola TaxID=656916 RepID=A0A2G7GBH1_9EURO|nr:hypothetical protein AARAC_007169 [Aspergillus arachidicola]